MTAEDVLAQYEQRINAHDFDLLVPLIARDAVFWFGDGSFAGLDAIRGAFEATWGRLADEHYWLEDRRWIAVGEGAAACTYHFRWRATVDGEARLGGGRGTTVVRGESGVWRIVHEHLSGFPGA